MSTSIELALPDPEPHEGSEVQVYSVRGKAIPRRVLRVVPDACIPIMFWKERPVTEVTDEVLDCLAGVVHPLYLHHSTATVVRFQVAGGERVRTKVNHASVKSEFHRLFDFRECESETDTEGKPVPPPAWLVGDFLARPMEELEKALPSALIMEELWRSSNFLDWFVQQVKSRHPEAWDFHPEVIMTSAQRAGVEGVPRTPEATGRYLLRLDRYGLFEACGVQLYKFGHYERGSRYTASYYAPARKDPSVANPAPQAPSAGADGSRPKTEEVPGGDALDPLTWCEEGNQP